MLKICSVFYTTYLIPNIAFNTNNLIISLNYNIMKTRTYYVINGTVCATLQDAQELKRELK